MMSETIAKTEPDAAAKFLDQWLMPNAGTPLEEIAETLSADVERAIGRRAYKGAAQRRNVVVRNVVANVLDTAMGPGGGIEKRLAVSTANAAPTRYDRADYPYSAKLEVLRAMEETGSLIIHPYSFRRLQTTVEPSAKLLTMIAGSGARPRHLKRDPGGETIWLAARTGQRRGGPFATTQNRVMPYEDTRESVRFRVEMERINAAIRDTEITFDGEPIAPFHLKRRFLLRSQDAPVAFDLNGRISGGSWTNLPSGDRWRLRLCGEPVADLDFSAAFVNLAYVYAGVPLPNAEAYALPGLEDHRDGAKKGMLSLLSRQSDLRLLSPELKQALPEGWTARRLVEAATAHHPRIAHLFGQDLGAALMFTESQIMVKLLLMLAERRVPFLQMYDGGMCRKSDRDVVEHCMNAASYAVIGRTLPIREKPIVEPRFA
jgi:hypothetical protein